LRRMILLAVSALVAAVLPASAYSERSALPPPGICRDPAWFTVTTGPTTAFQQDEPPQVFALTVRANPAALTPFDVVRGLPELDGSGALIWATTVSRGQRQEPFERRAWPPHLTDFRLDRKWEGQPSPRIQQRLLWVAASGWNLDVRVYFGTQHPSKTLVASVQAELSCLELPRS
jgi:hypothetical protein